MKPPRFLLGLLSFFPLASSAAEKSGAGRATVLVDGEILDAETTRLLPARLHVRGSDGTWHFPKSASASGSAIRYERQRANTASVEMRTTLSAHPFRLELAPGRHTFTVERGKEWVPETREVTVEPARPKPRARPTACIPCRSASAGSMFNSMDRSAMTRGCKGSARVAVS